MSLEATLDIEMTPFQRVLFVRSVGIFASLSPEVAAVVAEHSRESFFPKGSFLYRQNQKATMIRFIVRGRVEIRRHGVPVRVMHAKQVVGGPAAVSEDDQGYDCVALEDTITLEVSADDMRDIFEDHFDYLREVLGRLAQEVIQARLNLPGHAGFTAELRDDLIYPDEALDLVEKMALLRRTFTFAEGRIDALSDLAKHIEVVRHDKGHRLWKAGDSAHDFLLLLGGRIHGTTEKHHSFRLGPMDAAGSLEALASRNRWYDAVVEEDLVAFRVEAEVFYDVLEDNADMAYSVLRAFGQAQLKLYDRQAEFNSKPPVKAAE